MKSQVNIDYSQGYTNSSRKEIIKKVKKELSRSRFQHVLRVEQTAIEIAEIYDVDVEKVSIAALLHDYAKERSNRFMKDTIINENLELEMLDYGNQICHGPVASALAKKEFGITNKEILNAIYYHTFGSKNMSDVEKVIFIADYIEPKRKFKEADKARKNVKKSLDKTVSYIVKKTLINLIEKERKVYPKALETYNETISN